VERNQAFSEKEKKSWKGSSVKVGGEGYFEGKPKYLSSLNNQYKMGNNGDREEGNKRQEKISLREGIGKNPYHSEKPITCEKIVRQKKKTKKKNMFRKKEKKSFQYWKKSMRPERGGKDTTEAQLAQERLQRKSGGYGWGWHGGWLRERRKGPEHLRGGEIANPGKFRVANLVMEGNGRSRKKRASDIYHLVRYFWGRKRFKGAERAPN